MATRRTDKPYIHVTWLAKILGGHQCLWSAWFRAHFRYDKYEEQALDLVEWNREHNELMRRRRLELEREGFSCTVENQNDFKLEGDTAIVAGKPDIVATRPELTLIVDGKTGRERDSDIHQVFLYLWAWPKVRRLQPGALEGEVQYKRGDQRISLSSTDLTPARINDITSLVKVIASDTPPVKVPSHHECRFCNIGPKDCPQRVRTKQPSTMVTDF